MQETHPNFFIVGAPKCGTTALAHYLSEHPDVFISTPKEPLYFMHPECSLRKVRNRTHYLKMFRGAKDHTAVGEASVWYLYSDHARTALRENYPEAKVIIMVRNPVDFVSSLHRQQCFAGVEQELDFERAWRASVRYSNTLDPNNTIEKNARWQRCYAELGKHSKYVEAYLDVFGMERVFLVTQAAFASRTQDVYEQILRFLDLPPEGRQVFPRVNQARTYRSRALQKLLWALSKNQSLAASARALKSQLGIGSFRILATLKALNSQPASPAPLPRVLQNELANYFRIESEQMDQLLRSVESKSGFAER